MLPPIDAATGHPFEAARLARAGEVSLRVPPGVDVAALRAVLAAARGGRARVEAIHVAEADVTRIAEVLPPALVLRSLGHPARVVLEGAGDAWAELARPHLAGPLGAEAVEAVRAAWRATSPWPPAEAEVERAVRRLDDAGRAAAARCGDDVAPALREARVVLVPTW